MADVFASGIYVKVPVMMQANALECGVVSLAMILAYHGKWVPLQQVREACGVSRDGVSGKNLLAAARSFGLEGRGKRVEEIDPAQIPLPCILHYNNNHFVVFCGYRSGKAVINDPARGRILVSREEFQNVFHGFLMMCTPGEQFVRDGVKPDKRAFVGRLIRSYRKEMAFLLFSGLLATMIGVIAPPLKQIFIDRALAGNDFFLAKTLGFLILALFFFEAAVVITDIIAKNKINRKVSFEAGESFFRHLMNLDMGFFSSHMTGDLVGRQKSNEAISRGIIQQLAPVLQQLITIVLYVAIMLLYDVRLSVIGIGMSAASMALSLYVSSRQMDIVRAEVQEQTAVRSYSAFGISAMEAIKASGAEQGFYACWADKQAQYNNRCVQKNNKSAWILALPQFAELISTATIVVIAALLIMKGRFTIGALMAFQAFLAAFYSPMQALTELFRQLQMMNVQIDRVEDVLRSPADAMDLRAGKQELGAVEASLHVEGLSFGYGRLQPPVLREVSFDVNCGGSIGIAGGSGSGKSTLISLLLGLYQRWTGEISYGGISIDAFSRADLAGFAGVVRQESTLFAGTVRENLKMWDDTISDEAMICAAKDMCIHDEIMQRKGGYDSPVAERGANFSGGQRQKLELARALIRNPKLLVLDEATSALDSITEEKIMQNLRERGITSVIVAHRLAALRQCDEILVFKHGRIVQSGTHEQLLAEPGIYSTLAESENNE